MPGFDRSKCNKATAADDEPTPGYLYGEIAQVLHFVGARRFYFFNHFYYFTILILFGVACPDDT